MSTPNDGGPAHHDMHCHCADNPRLSLRDWFAGQALVGILACPAALSNGDERVTSLPQMAKASYEMADAMIAAREDTKP